MAEKAIVLTPDDAKSRAAGASRRRHDAGWLCTLALLLLLLGALEVSYVISRNNHATRY